MKRYKKLIFCVIVGTFIAGIFIAFACTRISSYTVYYPFSGRLFDINPSELKQICIIDGTTGETIDYSEPEDLSRLVSDLNGLRYNYWVPMVPISKGGWTYRMLFYGQDEGRIGSLSGYVIGLGAPDGVQSKRA